MQGRADARYLVTPQGVKAFLSDSGGTYPAPFALQIPNGASIDFGGATLVGPVGSDATLISNLSSSGGGQDRISVSNVVIDGQGNTAKGSLAAFVGCRNSRFAGIRVTRARRVVLSLQALSGCVIDDIEAWDIVGQAISLGGNDAHQLRDCVIGSLSARNIASYGTFHQPGNGFLIGGKRLRIASLLSRNCGGGIKFTANCDMISCGSLTFDGQADPGTAANGTQNSGSKIQGDVDARVGRIRIATIASRDCTGAGLFVRNAQTVVIGSYSGLNNGLANKDSDVDCDAFGSLQIASIASSGARQRNMAFGSRSGLVRIGRLDIDSLAAPGGSSEEALRANGGKIAVSTCSVRGRSDRSPAALFLLARTASAGSRIAIESCSISGPGGLIRRAPLRLSR